MGDILIDYFLAVAYNYDVTHSEQKERLKWQNIKW